MFAVFCACMAGCVNEDDFESKTLLQAAEAGDLEAAQFLLNPENINQADSHGRTPAGVALMRGDHDVATFLLHNGAKVPKMPEGRAPILHYLVLFSDMEGLRLALHYGADPNEEYLVQSGERAPDKMTVLAHACRLKKSGMVRLLLDHKADPNQKWGIYSALEEAVLADDLASIKLLVNAGARDAKAALDLARRKSNTSKDVLTYLADAAKSAE